MSHFIDGKRIYLREVRENDIDGDYYGWINDKEINQYMETRFSPQGKISLMESTWQGGYRQTCHVQKEKIRHGRRKESFYLWH